MVRRLWGSLTGKSTHNNSTHPKATPPPQVPPTNHGTPSTAHSHATKNAPDRSLKVLADFVEITANKGVDGLIKEYKRLDHFFDTSATFDAFRTNMNKNRYSDVRCADETRVRLWFGAEEFGDYIHANRILDEQLQNRYICTQGPISQTAHDFWRMIFQERIGNIVMLCRAIEDGKPKCAVYWPDKIGEVKKTPTLTIRNVESEEGDFTSTTFIVEINPKYAEKGATAGLSQSQSDPLTVRLLRWNAWPDGGVPEQSTCLLPLMLLQKARQLPTVIHCSAGIGRTGCLIAMEMALERVNRGRKLDFEQIVRELRCWRAQCIQTEIQYLYLHRITVEYAILHKNLSPEAVQVAKPFLSDYDSRLKQ